MTDLIKIGKLHETMRSINLFITPSRSDQGCLYYRDNSLALRFLLIFSHLAPQAVECLAEWALVPTNLVFRRISANVFDPVAVGDKERFS